MKPLWLLFSTLSLSICICICGFTLDRQLYFYNYILKFSSFFFFLKKETLYVNWRMKMTCNYIASTMVLMWAYILGLVCTCKLARIVFDIKYGDINREGMWIYVHVGRKTPWKEFTHVFAFERMQWIDVSIVCDRPNLYFQRVWSSIQIELK